MRWAWRPGFVAIAWIAVAIGLLPMPGEYYVLVRVFFCGIGIYFLTRPAGVRDVERWVLTGLVVLYNPLVPVELGSGVLWTAVAIATVAYFHVLDRRAGARRW
ncbi:MAG: DUF6804 family protein [Vicinamibacterales bacterium]